MPSGMPHGMFVPGIVDVAQPLHRVASTPVADQHEVDEREHQVADHRDQEDLGRPLRCADLAAREQREGDADDDEGAEHGLGTMPWKQLSRTAADAADEDALGRGVGEDQRRRRLLLKMLTSASTNPTIGRRDPRTGKTHPTAAPARGSRSPRPS